MDDKSGSGASWRRLDPQGWPRRVTFEHFRHFDRPHFGVCTRLDVGALLTAKAALGAGGLTIAYHHAALHAANEVEAMRMRLAGDEVRVHEAVYGSTTVLLGDESITFASLAWHRDFAAFHADASRALAAARRGETPLDPGADDDALVHFTVLPWFDFTSFTHARPRAGGDSIPKIAFGRIVAGADGRHTMAVAVEVHHALVDGLHVGRFVQAMQRRLDDAPFWATP